MLKVSVAMAAYNGEKYIAEQIDSILPQLRESDELIISINPSSDNTENIVKQYCENDTRIKMSICKEKGVLANFENAIRLCNNDIIFLSDQDDVWFPNKIIDVCHIMQVKGLDALAHKSLVVDSKLLPFQKQRNTNSKVSIVKPINILFQNKIQGSCLAFKKELLSYILPFPERIPMHDSWIGMIIATYGKIGLSNETYMYYRQHDNNVTSRKHKPLMNMIEDRFNLLLQYILRRINVKGRNCNYDKN